MSEIVENWIADYKQNQENAALTLVQFFVDASGCKAKVTHEMLEIIRQPDDRQSAKKHPATVIVEQLSKDLAQNGYYPLITQALSKLFIKELSNFVETLIEKCLNSIAFDAFLFDNAAVFLGYLCLSEARAFRHTSTFIAIKLHTALVHVDVKMKKQLETIERQDKVERDKPKEERAINRLETLNEKRLEFNENIEEIKWWTDFLFTQVFDQRYLDILPEIRSICLVEFDNWMKIDHKTYVKSNYLITYVGFLLFDDSSDVRIKSLQILQRIFSAVDQHRECLKKFIQCKKIRIRERIIAMKLDEDDNAAAESVILLIYIYKFDQSLMTNDDISSIYSLIYLSSRKLAQAAGDFFKATLVVGNEDTSNVPSLNDLIIFFLESNRPDRGPYLVDALIDTTPVLKDWKSMTNYLLVAGNNASPGDEEMINECETTMIKLMSYAVKQTATGEIPVGRVAPKKQLSVKAKDKIKAEIREITEYFIIHLPILLEKYQGDAEKLAHLLAIPQFFELSIYTELRQEKNLDLLLDCIETAVSRIFNEEVLEVAAKTLEVICNDELLIFTRCDTQRLTLIDEIFTKFNQVFNEIKNSDESYLNKETMYKLEESLMKISKFSRCHNLNNTNYWDSLIEIIFKRIEEEPMVLYPDKIIKYAMCGCYYSLLWSHHCFINNESGDSTIGGLEDTTILHRLNKLMEWMRTILIKTHDKFSDYLKDTAYTTVADLFYVFINPNVESGNSTSVSSYSYYCCPTNYLVDNVLERFIEKYVLRDPGDETLCFEKRLNLHGYCRLINNHLVPVELALPLFTNYLKFYNDFGDIIKMTLGSIRDNDRIKFAVVMEKSLNHLWSKIDRDEELEEARQIADILELAQRLSLLFGLDQNKNSNALAVLHRNGIEFALNLKENPVVNLNEPPSTIEYVKVLGVFTNKLTKKAKEYL